MKSLKSSPLCPPSGTSPSPNSPPTRNCPSLQELRLVRETSEMALGDYERRRENELQEVRLTHIMPEIQ